MLTFILYTLIWLEKCIFGLDKKMWAIKLINVKKEIFAGEEKLLLDTKLRLENKFRKEKKLGE